MLPGTALEEGRVVAPVTLTEPASGETVSLAAFRHRRAVVLCFLHEGCADCRSFAADLAALGDDLRWAEAVAYGVAAEDDLPLPVLLDRDGRARRELLGEGHSDPVIVVLDRYGAPAASFPSPEHRFPEAREVAGTVLHTALECPECGVPHWPQGSEA